MSNSMSSSLSSSITLKKEQLRPYLLLIFRMDFDIPNDKIRKTQLMFCLFLTGAYLEAWRLLERDVSLRGAFIENKSQIRGAFVRSITVYNTLFITFWFFEYFAYFMLFNYKRGYSETIFAFWHFTFMSQFDLCSSDNRITK